MPYDITPTDEIENDNGKPEPELVLETGDPMTAKFVQFVELAEQKRELNRQLKSVEAAIGRLEPALLEYLQSKGFRHIKTQYPEMTLWLREELWARPRFPGERARVCQALRSAGGDWESFVEVDFNTLTLSSYVRGLKKANQKRIDRGEIDSVADLLPKDLSSVLNVNSNFRVQGRRRS